VIVEVLFALLALLIAAALVHFAPKARESTRAECFADPVSLNALSMPRFASTGRHPVTFHGRQASGRAFSCSNAHRKNRIAGPWVDRRVTATQRLPICLRT
jgi:hypothetical protein